MLEKGQIHSGMRLVGFAVNESQKRRTRPPYHKRGVGRQHQILNLDMVRVAPTNRLTDTGRPSTTPSDKQQHSSSKRKLQQQRRGGGGGGDGPAR